MSDKIDYGALVDKTTEQITEMIKRGEIPTQLIKGEERKRLDAFALSDPGSDVRKAFLSPETSSTPVPEPTPDKVPEAPEPQPSTQPQTEPSKPVEDQTQKSLRDLGYKSEQEAYDAILSNQAANDAMRKTIDRLNGQHGSTVRRQKELEAKIADLERANEEIKKAVPAQPAGASSLPTLPDPAKFDDGVLSSEYQTAMVKYNADLADYYQRTIKDRDAAWEAKLRSVEERANKALEVGESQVQEREAQRTQGEWDTFWGDVAGFQKQYGLTTTVPVAEMNAVALDMRSSDKAVRDAATHRFNGYSAQDRERLDKVFKAIHARFAFDERSGMPVQRYKKWEAAFADQDLTGEYNYQKDTGVPPQEAERLKQQQQDTTLPPPASAMSAGDPPLSGKEEDKWAELRALNEKNQAAAAKGPEALRQYTASADYARQKALLKELSGAFRAA